MNVGNHPGFAPIRQPWQSPPTRLFGSPRGGKELRLDIGKGFEFQRVATGVFEKHRVLFAGFSFEANVWFDDEVINKRANTIGERVPHVDFEDDTEMRNRDCMVIDRVVVLGDAALRAQCRVEVRDQLVAEEIEIDPRGVAASFGQSHFDAIEFACFIDVTDLDGEMKRGKHGGVPLRLVCGGRRGNGNLSATAEKASCAGANVCRLAELGWARRLAPYG